MTFGDSVERRVHSGSLAPSSVRCGTINSGAASESRRADLSLQSWHRGDGQLVNTLDSAVLGGATTAPARCVRLAQGAGECRMSVFVREPAPRVGIPSGPSPFVVDPFGEEPIRGELLSLEQLEANAKHLALAAQHPRATRGRPLLPRFAED